MDIKYISVLIKKDYLLKVKQQNRGILDWLDRKRRHSKKEHLVVL